MTAGTNVCERRKSVVIKTLLKGDWTGKKKSPTLAVGPIRWLSVKRRRKFWGETVSSSSTPKRTAGKGRPQHTRTRNRAGQLQPLPTGEKARAGAGKEPDLGQGVPGEEDASGCHEKETRHGGRVPRARNHGVQDSRHE